jgi:hypothetical protein
MVWAVDKISDTVGNFMLFKYNQGLQTWGSGISGPTSGTEWNLAEVWYTGTAGQAPNNKVVFGYAARTGPLINGSPTTGSPTGDGSEAYQAGHKNVDTQLLQSVTTYVNVTTPMSQGSTAGKPAKYYNLTWGTGSTTNRYLLQTVAECNGAATACLPATQFNYYQPSSSNPFGYYESASAYNLSSQLQMTDVASSNAGLGHAYGILTGNFMGTGRTDIIGWNDTPSNNQLWASNGDSSFSKNLNFNITGTNLGMSNGCFGAIVADFNGDGLDDILEYENPTNNSGGTCYSGSPTNYLFINNGNGSFTANPISIPLVQQKAGAQNLACRLGNINQSIAGWSPGQTFYILDVNGDGYLDIITTTLNAGVDAPGWACSVPNTTSASNAGTSNLYLGNAGTAGAYSFTGSNSSFSLAAYSLYSDPPSSLVYPIPTFDINGDGYTDLNIVRNAVGAPVAGLYISQGNGSFTLYQLNYITCDQQIDANGDGKPDCLYLSNSASGASNSLLMTDDTLIPLTTSTFSGGAGLASVALSTVPGATPNVGIAVADVNGDGRGDIIVWNNTKSSNALYVSNGDGSFSAALTNLTNWQLRNSGGNCDFVLGDFTGHGTPEILIVDADGTCNGSTGSTTWGSILLVKQDPNPADQLLSVVSPTGAETNLSWASLANANGAGGNVYTPDAPLDVGKLILPTVDLSPALWVVSSVSSDSGLGAAGSPLYEITSYSYAGLKADIQGRGALGFRQVSKTGPGADGTNLTVMTSYLQSYPYIGLAASTTTAPAGSSSLLSETWDQYCDLRSTGTVPAISASDASEVTTTALPACANSGFLVKQPYLLATYEQGWGLDGIVLPDVLTTNAYASIAGHVNTGDPTSITTVTGSNPSNSGGVTAQSFTKTVTNSFNVADSSGSNWVLGRLSAATVQNTVAGTNSLTASAGTSSLATATSGQTEQLTVSVAPPATATANVASGTQISTTAVPIYVSPYPTAPITYTVTRVSTTTTEITGSVNTSVSPATATFSSTQVGPGQWVTETFQITAVDAAGNSGTSANVAVTISNGLTTAATFTSATGSGAGASSITASGTTLSGSVGYNNGSLANVYTLSFSNSGMAPMTLTGLAFTGSLTGVLSTGSTNSCAAVAIGASCTIGVTANSNATTGNNTGTWATVGAVSNAGGNMSEWIGLTEAQWGGTQRLSFGAVTVNSTSAPQTISLTNTGNNSASWTGLANLPAGFSATLTGCSSVAPGASCSVTVTFAPTTSGSYGGGNISPTPAATLDANYLTVSGTGARKAVTVAISSSTANYSLTPSQASGYVPKYTDVTLSISGAGTYVYSTSPSTPALTVSGFASGDTVTLTGNGEIYGAGGAGGAGGGSSTPGGSGGATGGDAISLSFPISFSSFTGVVAGGGGGGGGGGSAVLVVKQGPPLLEDTSGGGGGGAGAGFNGAAGGAGGGFEYSGIAGGATASPATGGASGGAGGIGTTSGSGGGIGAAGGNAPAVSGSYTGGGGGGGGGLGGAGGAGASGSGGTASGAGASGGNPGYGIRKNGNNVSGTLPTVYGAVQ